MTKAQVYGLGNYRFVPGVFQYSAGVAAEPGFRIERVRLMNVVNLAEGFRLIETTLKEVGRPLSASRRLHGKSGGIPIGQLLQFDHVTTRHYKLNILVNRHILQWVARDGDDVSAFARCDCADLIGQAE